MATVFWRGKQWVAQWYRPDGKRVKRATCTSKKREAERIAAEMESSDRSASGSHGVKLEKIISRAGADAKAGKLSLQRAEEYILELRRTIDPEFRKLSVSEYLTGWIEAKKMRVTSATLKTYQTCARHFLKHLGSKVIHSAVADLTPAHIEKAVASLKASGLRGSTINLSLRSFRQALRQAVRDDIAIKNAAEGIPSLPETDTVDKAPFTADEVRLLMDSCPDEEWAGLILLASQTGLRLTDSMRLHSSHIQGDRFVIQPAKTSGQKKVVIIPISTAAKAWIGERQGNLFPVISAMKPGTVAARFRHLMRKSGVASRVEIPGSGERRRSFHSLRHSFASWLADAEVQSDVRQKLTGHSSAKVHAVYTHHDKALDRAIEKLPTLSARS